MSRAWLPWLLLLPATAFAQNISVGFRGGVPLTEAFSTVNTAAAGNLFRNRPSRWIAGPTVEVRLPFGFGVTLDALYNRLGFENAGSTDTGGQWEFPAMVRYRLLPAPIVKPFIAAGGSFGKITGLRTPSSSVTGIVFGGGLEIKVPFLRIAPEIRFTRMLSESVTVGTIRSNVNQAVFLVGLTF